MTPSVGFVGVHGHGASHVLHGRELAARGRIRISGVADPVPPRPTDAAAGLAHHPDLDALLATDPPDVVVLSTPIHTHLPLATTALEAGCAVLLEKPPTPGIAEFRALAAAAEASGRPCQIGFQTFGAQALRALRHAVRTGALGSIGVLGVHGHWLRTVDYFRRAPWAGRRVLDGVPVMDGVATNPLAHGIASALFALDATGIEDVVAVEVDAYRVNDISTDDTTSIRITTRSGTVVLAALTLCAPHREPPALLVRGEHGTARLDYDVDRLVLPGAEPATLPRTSLLENLLDHLADPDVELFAPLPGTAAFTAVLQAVADSPVTPVPDEHVDRVEDGAGTHLVLRGVGEALTAAVESGKLFRELPAPWTREQGLIVRSDRG
jgi:predicted dehydrogenase